MIRDLQKAQNVEILSGRADFAYPPALNQPDELITWRDGTVQGQGFDVGTPTGPPRRSPKKTSFLRSSLKEHRERQRNQQFYLTKPTFRATGDFLIPRLFAESFDASSAA